MRRIVPPLDGVRAALAFILAGAVLGWALWPLADQDAGLLVSARTGAVLGLLLWGCVVGLGYGVGLLRALFRR
ncbi:hypothetical protein [Nocardioides pacificus]